MLASLAGGSARAFGFTTDVVVSAPVLTYLGNSTDIADASSYTFTNFAIGQPGLIVVAAQTEQGAGQVTGVTIGGVTATEAISVVTASGVVSRVSLFYARVVAGSTATIVVTYPGTMVRCLIGVWRLDNVNSDTPLDTGSHEFPGNSASQTLTITLDSQVGAVGIVAAVNGTISATITMSGVTVDYSTAPESLSYCFGASYTEDGASTVLNGNFNGNGQGSAMAGAVWY